MPLVIFHMMVHRKKQFYIDSCPPIGLGVLTAPLPGFQNADALCHADLCWCPTLWHQRSPGAKSKNHAAHETELS